MQKKNARLIDVARQAGVGAGTVSRVLNGDAHVSEATRMAVEEAMRQLQYKPNVFARGLKSRKSRTMGVMVADITSSFFAKIIRGIEETLQESGFELVLFDTGMQQEKVTRCIEVVRDKMLDGLFVLGEHLDKEQFQQLVEWKLPTVAITMEVPLAGGMMPPNFASITINNERAAFCATDFLCGRGYHRIALLMSPMDDENVGKARYTGYCHALSRNKIPLDPALISCCEILSQENGYKNTQKLLQSGVEFDAVFAVSDLAALGALRALHEAGQKVPQDIAVIGFDGIEEGLYNVPSLTTIDQPRFLMGQEGARRMLELVQGKQPLQQETILNYTFIERESTCI